MALRNKKKREVVEVKDEKAESIPSEKDIPKPPSPDEAKYNADLARIAQMSHAELEYQHLLNQAELILLMGKVYEVLEKIHAEDGGDSHED